MYQALTTRAFSLIEVLLIIAVLAILGSAGAAYYRTVSQDVGMSSTAKNLIAELKTARNKAMAGEEQRKWGVHLVNGTRDYYELFSSPTIYTDPQVTIEETVYLIQGIGFSDPPSAGTKDIIFSSISGTTTASSLTITSEGKDTTVQVTAIGTIY